jgi:hypothetical protein
MCQRAPNALPVAAYFAQKKLIKLDRNVGGDSVSCWQLSRSFNLKGLSVIGFCASTEDPLTRALWPDVFYRGPGTSPGILLSVSTELPLAAVQSWAHKHGIEAKLVGKSDWFDGLTQVECNSLSLTR